jgi:hypothetical protein
MAGTYYKYAEREADSYVNWGEIGKNLTDMLQEQNKIREDKKAAIDASSREFGETLANAPQGEQKQLNQWALEYASDAQQARLLQDRLLKSGGLSVKDYTVMRQNINDGTKQAFNLVKEYQEEYKVKMERVKQDKSQDLEAWLMQQAEGFGNFAKSKLYINPTNFQVSVAGTKKQMVNGKEVYVMETDPNKFTTVNALRNRMKGTYDKYDLPGNVKGMVDNLGVEIDSVQKLASLYQTGTITETLDITKRTNLPADAKGVIIKFEEAETKMLQAQLQNPYNTSSILTNTVGMAPNGKQYTYTFSKEERDKNPNLILLNDSETGNPVPEFTPEQEKAALERLRLEARMQYDKKVEIKTTPQVQLQERRAKTEAEMGREDAQNEAKNFGRMLALAVSGNATQRRQAADYFKATKGITGLEFTDKGINILEGATALPYEYTTGGKDTNSETLGRAMVKALNKAGLPEDVIIQAMKANLVSPNVSKVAIGRIGREAIDYANEVGQYAATQIDNGVVIDSPTKTKANLESKLAPLGFKVTGRSSGSFNQNDFITITAPNGKSKEFPIDTKASNAEIANFITDNRSDKLAEQSGLFGSKTGGTTPAAAAPAAAAPAAAGGDVKTRVSGY